MTIGKLASTAGVPISTIRFFERAGLLTADLRTAGNYREYSAQSLDRLRFIRSAQAVGLSVRDVAELLTLTAINSSPCTEVEQILQRRLTEIREKMQDLRRVERTLIKAISTCCTPDDPGLCVRPSKPRR